MHARCHDEKVGKRMKYYMYVGKVLLAQYIHTFTLEIFYVIREAYNKQ